MILRQEKKESDKICVSDPTWRPSDCRRWFRYRRLPLRYRPATPDDDVRGGRKNVLRNRRLLEEDRQTGGRQSSLQGKALTHTKPLFKYIRHFWGRFPHSNPAHVFRSWSVFSKLQEFIDGVLSFGRRACIRNDVESPSWNLNSSDI